jgi:hypothetical protein
MKKFKVLEVNNKIESVTDHFNCNQSSYTVSCTVKNIETNEIVTINEDSTDDFLIRIIEMIDNYDLVVNDEFIIR